MLFCHSKIKYSVFNQLTQIHVKKIAVKIGVLKFLNMAPPQK